MQIISDPDPQPWAENLAQEPELLIRLQMDPDLFARSEFGSALKFRIRILSDTWNFLPENIRRKKMSAESCDYLT